MNTSHAPSPGPSGAPNPLRRAQAIEALYATAFWLIGERRFQDAAEVLRVMARFAPADERAWLALGTCHEGLHQTTIALEMYGVGRVLAGPSVRCEIARVRLLRRLGRDGEADDVLDQAATLAEDVGDDELDALVRAERRAS